MRSKAASYLGLARRAGKLTLGVNACSTIKSCFLLVADTAIGPNSRKEAEGLQRRLACPLIFLEDLGEMTGKQGCVLAAVREEHLAQALLKETGGV